MKTREWSVWIVLLVAWATFTFIATEDRVNWMLDAGWVVVGFPTLLLTRRIFPLSPLLYRLLAVHAIVLIAGGFWTYEKNPIGLWFQSMLGTERNHFDRFGHFMQGFVPAIFFREIYSRCSPVRNGAWLSYFSFVSCLAFIALFELIEWVATVLAGAEGGEFLGHQGDIWDAQWDITWAIIGCVLSLLCLSRIHDAQLARVARNGMPVSEEP